MWGDTLLLVTLFLVIVNQTLAQDEVSKCVGNSGSSQKTQLSIKLRKSDAGEWDTKFSAERNTSISSDMFDVDLIQDVAECSTHRILSIRGEVKGLTRALQKEGFLFHKSCSPNAAITNGGLTLRKYKEAGRASAITNRPLMGEEIFRIRLDRRSSEYPFGIGVTSHSPGSIDIPDHMNDIKSGTWLFYNTHLYVNGPSTLNNYIKSDVRNAKVGDVYGVMRSKFGSLHLYVNGVDQGPAARIPENVYGAFSLYDGGLEATIIN